MTFGKITAAMILAIAGTGLINGCTAITDRPAANATPQDIAVSRTSQRRSVQVAQSDFVFSTSVQVVKRLGFMIEASDPDRMMLQAFKVHNGHRIVFRLAVVNKGRTSLIKMNTQYFDVPAYDYDEPYESYSAIMWDYLGEKLEKVGS